MVHVRTTEMLSKENLYAQVTVRLHSQQVRCCSRSSCSCNSSCSDSSTGGGGGGVGGLVVVVVVVADDYRGAQHR